MQTQFANAFSSFASSLKPLGDTVSKGITQATQTGNAGDVTELPLEYRQLEEKVENMKIVYEQFLKVSKNYANGGAYDYEPDLTDRASDFASVISTNATSLAGRITGNNDRPNVKVSGETPISFSHAFAKAAYTSANLVGDEEPFVALKKFGAAQEKMGNFRIQQDQDANLKFYTPMLAAYNTRVNDALKARRNVQSLRLTYDGLRHRLKTAPPESVDALRTETERAEDEFVGAVDDAMGKMKAVVINGEPLRCLADLVAIQLQYHKSLYETLAQLGPELDELVVTNEALYAPTQ